MCIDRDARNIQGISVQSPVTAVTIDLDPQREACPAPHPAHERNNRGTLKRETGCSSSEQQHPPTNVVTPKRWRIIC